MNPEFKQSYSEYPPYDRILELTSKGYTTREAKRKIIRDDKRKQSKIWRNYNARKTI